jgi:D-sedoheptulose 7-phosphate isomerase
MQASLKQQISDSIKVKQALLNEVATLDLIMHLCTLFAERLDSGKKIIFAGNGGSAADSQHLAAEFVSRFNFDRPGLSAIALTTDTSMLTAIGNDYGYEHIFARQLEAQGRNGDVFVGITTSGKSKNVLRAFEVCKNLGITSVALCGQGGSLEQLVDHWAVSSFKCNG